MQKALNRDVDYSCPLDFFNHQIGGIIFTNVKEYLNLLNIKNRISDESMVKDYLKLGTLPYKTNYPINYRFYQGDLKWFTTHTLITYDHQEICNITLNPITSKNFVMSLPDRRFMLLGRNTVITFCEKGLYKCSPSGQTISLETASSTG